MSIRLFEIRGCPFAHRTRIILEEKKLPFEAVEFEQGKRPPELVALGPNAKSPTLFDGEVKVYVSSIVDEYLDDRYPDWPLMPPDASHRALVRLLMKEIDDDLVPSLELALRDPKKIDRAREAFFGPLPRFDRLIDGRSFLVGEEVTLADVHLYTLFPAMKRVLSGEAIPPGLSHLREWLATMAARPAVAKSLTAGSS